LEEGREIIKEIVTAMPLYKKIEESLEVPEEETAADEAEEEKPDEALIMSLKILDTLMRKVDMADRKIVRHGTLKDLKKVDIQGLMTIGPGWAITDPEASRACFKLLRDLRDELSQANDIRLPVLSMGMTSDFERDCDCFVNPEVV
jgi:uncharacterized pyridoxal phosphate-containing UPF0001 family protein